jgi:hypothetical protein
MSDSFLERLNPKFVTWFHAQSAGVKGDIVAQFEATAEHEDIAHNDPKGMYARKYRTLTYAAEKHGYDFP